MNDIIYFVGVLSLGFIGFLIFKKHQNYTIYEFNKKALLTVILTDYFSATKDIAIIKNEYQKMVSIDINYILRSIISITENLKHDNYKREFSSVYSKYVKDVILELRKKIQSPNDWKLINLEVEKYKNRLQDSFDKSTLIDLKLQKNKILYKTILESEITTDGISKIEFSTIISKSLNIDSDNIQNEFNELKDSETGLFYESNNRIYKNYNNIVWNNKKLSYELLNLSYELSILKNLDLNKV